MAVTYTCTQCNHVNEAERVYCHNCGVKLDRSLLPEEEKKEKEESPEQARKRILKMTNPAKGIFKMANVYALVKTALFAAIVAGIVQALRPPDNIPPLTKDLIDVPQIAERLEDEIAAPQSHTLKIPEQVANDYLQKTIRTAKGKDSSDYLKVARAYTHFEEGVCEMNLTLTVMDFPLYLNSSYHLEVEEIGSIKATSAGGAFGRLRIHPMIMKYAGAVFGNLWDALKREKKLFDQMKAVEVKKGEIVLTTYGSKPATPGAPAPAPAP